MVLLPHGPSLCGTMHSLGEGVMIGKQRTLLVLNARPEVADH